MNDKPLLLRALLRIWRAMHWLFRRPARSDLVALLLIWALALGVGVVAFVLMMLLPANAHATPLSAGDRVQVVIDNGEGFSGKYQVDLQGALALPLLDPVVVSGLDAQTAARRLAQQLEQQGLFRPGAARATVQVLWWAPLDISVSGEVFNPGLHRVNMPALRDRAVERAEEIPGAYTPSRSLSDALKAAGGITPWSDLSRVGLIRGGVLKGVDLRHMIRGTPGDDPPLHNADEVIVYRLAQARPEQVRPSGITPPGIKIYVGNLIQTQNNAPAANGIGTLSLTYGSRLAQAAVAANCLGGVGWANADRHAALIRTERVSGKTQVWEVKVGDFMHQASDQTNPMLQEGDALACFDSSVTGWREVFKTLTDLLTPISIFKGF